MRNNRAVILLSGGQDSATALLKTKQAEEIELAAAVTFDYGQRHKLEVGLAERLADKHGVPWTLVPVPEASISASSLTRAGITNSGNGQNGNRFAEERGLPPSFTPGRNLLFFTLGAMVGSTLDAHTLISGVCSTDRSGYPDCRPEFVAFMEAAIRQGFDWPEFRIYAPLLYASKAVTWQIANELGGLETIVMETLSCYEGRMGESDIHPWGYGCGECGACVERANGYEEFRGLVNA